MLRDREGRVVATVAPMAMLNLIGNDPITNARRPSYVGEQSRDANN